MLAWRNWQTRTAQDRMGKPVEVRVLSRAVSPVPPTAETDSRVSPNATVDASKLTLNYEAKQETCNASFDGLVTSSLQLSFWLPTALSLARRAFFARLA